MFYASLHQWPHYPGTGARAERGRGEGEGCTLNVPLAAGTGDAEWTAAMEQEVLPAVEAFAPDFLLVSAGFDAHARDPLSSTRLEDATYARFGRLLGELAERCCEGRRGSVL